MFITPSSPMSAGNALMGTPVLRTLKGAPWHAVAMATTHRRTFLRRVGLPRPGAWLMSPRLVLGPDGPNNVSPGDARASARASSILLA